MIKSINFEFVRARHETLADLGGFAEQYAHQDPAGAAVKIRIAVEECVFAIYAEKKLRTPLPPPYLKEPTLDQLIDGAEFTTVVPVRIRERLHAIRKIANKGAHRSDGRVVIDSKVALALLRDAFDVVAFTATFLRWVAVAPAFAEVPVGGAAGETRGQLQREKREALQQKAELEIELRRLTERDAEREKTLSELSTALSFTNEQLDRLREEAARSADVLKLDEAHTRAWLIDVMLEDAGWDLADRAQVAREVDLGASGVADYVLYDERAQPLVVIEAKRTARSPDEGRSQAVAYADALERATTHRPLLFCSNGLESWVWNDKSIEPQRAVFGMYSRRSAEKIIARRDRGDLQRLREAQPDRAIAGRLYQLEAVARTADHFSHGHRRALIVQATGTGKTRVAISISELLFRCNVVNRVLFLCDRLELRRQAMQAFESHLPAKQRTIIDAKLLEAWRNDARTTKHHAGSVFFATYPAMLENMRAYDIGFFDLVIADESHRSIYNRYRDLFLYYDALQLGLTATPVGFVDHNTYGLFGCSDKNPTYAYEYDEAIADGNLVPFEVLVHDTHFTREGIRWDEITREEQLQLVGGDEEAEPTDIEASEIDRQIFVEDTARRMLTVLMDHGIRDAEQTLPGKSIIFARSHRHAEFLKRVFDETWPQYKGTVDRPPLCVVIDSETHDPATWINRFKNEARPVIAISVDMLDTGIDIPEVVNLVFARPVRSTVKFWQMIGRGTRLCPDLFGPGQHKKSFLVIDHWANIERFASSSARALQESERANSVPLRERLFRAHIAVADASLEAGDGEALALAVGLVGADLLALIQAESLSIREHHSRLQSLNAPDRLARWDPALRDELLKLAPLTRWLPMLSDEVASLRFDLLVAETHRAMIERSSVEDVLRVRVIEEARRLPLSLKQVQDHRQTIEELGHGSFWTSTDRLARLERARAALRGLMSLLPPSRPPAEAPREVKIQDRDERISRGAPPVLTGIELDSYRRRVKALLDGMIAGDPVLQKVQRNEPVSDSELDGLAQRVMRSDPTVNLVHLPASLGAPGGLARTLRGLVGLDPERVREAFAAFIHGAGKLSAQQLQYLALVQRHIVRYGGIERSELLEEPFTNLAPTGLEALFRDARQVNDLEEVLDKFVASERQPSVA